MTARRRETRAQRRGSSGFTLVELMVALTGGLFVSIAVFMLAKQTTGLYQSEARVSNATLGSIVGFERLRADIARAGYLATPNVMRDPKLCGSALTTWPAYLSHLQSVMIQQNAAPPTQLDDNGIVPDEIYLAGAYASVEQFPVEAVLVNDSNPRIELQDGSPSMARLRYDPGADQDTREALLASVFGAGRILRIVDMRGRDQYLVIRGVDAADAASPHVLVEPNNPVPIEREGNRGGDCGFLGRETGALVNVVNIVRYRIADVATDTTTALYTRYAPIFDRTGGGPKTDEGRTELVREELDATGEVISGTEEIVTEFAVDLAFGVTVAQVVGTGSSAVDQLTTFAPGDTANLTQWVDSLRASSMDLDVRGPQFVRAVRARLSVRSREADRVSGVPAALSDGGGAPIAPGLYRFGLGADGFARVRTVQTEVALRNQREVTWPRQ